jgi:hypothetical protein
MRGTYGRTVLTLRLQTDSTIATDTEDPRYSRLEGTWTVSGTQFTATVDDGGGVLVTLIASAPFVHLTGSWNANNGSSGTFDLAKR